MFKKVDKINVSICLLFINYNIQVLPIIMDDNEELDKMIKNKESLMDLLATFSILNDPKIDQVVFDKFSLDVDSKELFIRHPLGYVYIYHTDVSGIVKITPLLSDNCGKYIDEEFTTIYKHRPQKMSCNIGDTFLEWHPTKKILVNDSKYNIINIFNDDYTSYDVYLTNLIPIKLDKRTTICSLQFGYELDKLPSSHDVLMFMSNSIFFEISYKNKSSSDIRKDHLLIEIPYKDNIYELLPHFKTHVEMLKKIDKVIQNIYTQHIQNIIEITDLSLFIIDYNLKSPRTGQTW